MLPRYGVLRGVGGAAPYLVRHAPKALLKKQCGGSHPKLFTIHCSLLLLYWHYLWKRG